MTLIMNLHENEIKFGTSGWRATIADGFTAYNVQRLTEALSSHVTDNEEYGFVGAQYQRHLKEHKITRKKPLVIIGYDTRYGSEYFARLVAETFAANGILVKLASAPAPTPAVAWTVVQYGAVGGVTVTAGESDYYMNGIKWTPFWGGPAIPEITRDIEYNLSGTVRKVTQTGINSPKIENPLVEHIDLCKSYLEHLKSLLNAAQIKKAKLSVTIDPLYGAASVYMRTVLESLGVEVKGIHENRDVLFGGHAPYTGPAVLSELSKAVKKNKSALGLACDSDGDRFGIIDAAGNWVSPNEILPLMLEHLVVNRKMKGRVARNIVTTHFLDAVAKKYGLEVRETPIGFKFIGELMRSGQYMIGGEESGGLTIAGHVAEKDGILACLLVVEVLAFMKKPLNKILESMHKTYGDFLSVKTSLALEDGVNVTRFKERLSLNPPLSIAGFTVWRIDETDGFKFILRDGSWLGLRPSSNEPIVRIYAEATNKKKLNELVEEGKKIIKGDNK